MPKKCPEKNLIYRTIYKHELRMKDVHHSSYIRSNANISSFPPLSAFIDVYRK